MTTMDTEFKLYQYWRSSCSWRVRWALLHKGLTYESVPVHLVEGAQSTPEYLKINPGAKVPTLVANGSYLTQSLSILEWLEETYPENSILPGSPSDRQKVRALAHIIACDVQPIQNFAVLKRIHALGGDKVKWAKETIEAGLIAYEATLEANQLPIESVYSFANTLTLADFCLIPQCYNAKRFGVDLKRLPRIAAINAHCLSLKDCLAASPETQIDAVV